MNASWKRNASPAPKAPCGALSPNCADILKKRSFPSHSPRETPCRSTGAKPSSTWQANARKCRCFAPALPTATLRSLCAFAGRTLRPSSKDSYTGLELFWRRSAPRTLRQCACRRQGRCRQKRHTTGKLCSARGALLFPNRFLQCSQRQRKGARGKPRRLDKKKSIGSRPPCRLPG